MEEKKRRMNIILGIILQIYFLFPWMNITGERKNFIMYVIAVLRNHSCADTYNTTFLDGAADALPLDIHTLAKTFTVCVMLYVVLEVIETIRLICNIKGWEIKFLSIIELIYLMDSLSVRENIMLPKILDKKSAKECMEESQKYAEQFGITHLMNKKPYELSGGEKQRVAISRALINNPDLILADEPTGNLDSKSGDVVIHTLSHINRELGKTIVMVTHDPKMASYCSRLILLKDGMILEDMRNGGDQEAFYQEILGKMKEL